MRDERVRGAPIPAPNDRRYYPIHRPRASEPVKAICLSDHIMGFWTHWIAPPGGGGGRTKPCYGEATCPYRHNDAGYHWYGFYASLTVPGNQHVGILLHRSGALAVLAASKEYGRLRGLEIRLTKSGPANWSPVIVQQTGYHQSDGLPASFDLGDSLCHLWAVDYLPTFAPLLKIAEGQ